VSLLSPDGWKGVAERLILPRGGGRVRYSTTRPAGKSKPRWSCVFEGPEKKGCGPQVRGLILASRKRKKKKGQTNRDGVRGNALALKGNSQKEALS